MFGINSNTNRFVARSGGFSRSGPHSRFINCVDENGAGFGDSSGITPVAAHGCLVKYQGYQADDGVDRGHTHGFYVQNATGVTKEFEECASLGGYASGFHIYGEDTALDDITLTGCVAAMPGLLADKSPGRNVNHNELVGGGGGGLSANRLTLSDFYSYAKDMEGSGVALAGDTHSVVGGRFANNDNAPLSGNPTNLTKSGTPKIDGSASAPWTTGTTVAAFGSGTDQVIVRPNSFERGRGHVIVYNWAHAASVSADLSSLGLVNGDAYYVFDGYNVLAGPVASGTYSGAAVSIPMTGHTLPAPVGGWQVSPVPTHPAPEFGFFILRKVATWVAPANADRIAA